MSSAVSAINCNLNCICVNNDCLYNHYIPYKDRKIVKRFYDALAKKNINEPGMDIRKKNCTFGQLCEKEDCGYKHRLSFQDREKLIVSYKFNKICPEPSQVAKTSTAKSDKPIFNNHNSFAFLEEESEEEEEVKEEEAIVVNNTSKTWASIVKNKKSTVEPSKKEISLNWEDCADDDFFMTFE